MSLSALRCNPGLLNQTFLHCMSYTLRLWQDGAPEIEEVEDAEDEKREVLGLGGLGLALGLG